MLIRNRLFKKSIFISWLLSYISILLIPILISIVIYAVTGKVVEDEINRSNLTLVNQIRQSMDNQLRDIERLSLEIAWNKNVEGLLGFKGDFKDHRYITNLAVRDFKVYSVATGLINNFYLYLKNGRFVITPTTACDEELFLSILEENDGINAQQWQDITGMKGKQSYLSVTRKMKDGKTMKTIVFVRPLPLGRITEPSGTIVVLLNEDRFQAVIKNVKVVKNGAVMIIDKNDSILAVTEGSEIPGFLKYEDTDSSAGPGHFRFNGEDIVVSRVNSQVADWQYVSIVNEKTYMEKVSFVRKLTWYSVLLCLVVGGLVAYLFLKKNYNPVNQLVQTLERKLGVVVDRTYNEYLFIQKTINNTLDEKEKMKENLKQQNAVLRDNFLARLLKGRFSSRVPVEEALLSYDIRFVSDYFAVLAFYVEDYSILFSAENGRRSAMDPDEQLELVQFIIGNMVEELVGKRNKGFMLEIDELLVCLVNFGEDQVVDGKSEMLKICSDVQQIMKNQFNTAITIAISGIHKTVAEIRTAYQQALETMECRIVNESRKILHYEDTLNSMKYFNYSLKMEQLLMNFIKAGDFEKAGGIFEEILKNNISDGMLSTQFARYLMFDLINTLLKAMDDLSIDYKEYFHGLDPVGNILKCNTLTEMKVRMLDILRELCSYFEKRKKSHNSKLKEELAGFINSNFQDMNMSISTIAYKFKLNPDYLSRFFREQSGESLQDYINKLRLNHAKQLLKAGKRSIQEISNEVGYGNASSFIRVFKKYEGITPGQYKELS